MRGWTGDLLLGIRLAVGGGRTSVVRFALSAVGIAVGVTVLLLGASAGTISDHQEQRDAADSIASIEPVDGVDPLFVVTAATEFRGEYIQVKYVHAEGKHPPLPNGIETLPAPGEMVASPALADLLGSPEGELLRPRFPEELVGTIGREMVPQPGDLIAYVGADAELAARPGAERAYGFGAVEEDTGPSRPALLLLVLIGAVVLLVPVFIFVASATRIAGAERDRRLSALRLVGAGSRQVRRIAAAETVVSALAGLVAGAAAFLVLRTFAEDVELLGLRVYRDDVVPDSVLVVLIVLAVPALAVLTALVALRRTIIEPLGVVRRAKPVRRRAWWRFLLVAVGAALLITGGGASRGSDGWGIALSAGAVLLLVGVPVLLPWLVERIAGRITGGPSSWQLAIRRLQLDSGTSARVVGGVAVVLAGAIALQTMLTSVEYNLGLPATGADQLPEPTINVEVVGADLADDVVAKVRTVAAVRDAYVVSEGYGYEPGKPDGAGGAYILVMDCATVREFAGIDECSDGEVLVPPGADPVPPAGTELEFREYRSAIEGDYESLGTWTVPDRVRVPTAPAGEEPEPDDSGPDALLSYASLIATPGAFDGGLPTGLSTRVQLEAGTPTSDQLEQIRNSVADLSWRAYVFSMDTVQDVTADQAVFLATRNALYAASVFTLLLAAVSLLVLALEHIRERRRPLAMLVASGVPRSVLARSMLWQVVLPIAIGVVVAVLTGIGLGWSVLRASDEDVVVDWLGIGLLSSGAALLSVLVTTLTLPFLRSATRLTSLRTE